MSTPRRRCCITNGSSTRRQTVNATICYSIKSSGNINLCKLLAKEGCGFDVTSGGELFRALQAGGDPTKIIYAGVGKTDEEIRSAIDVNIAAFISNRKRAREHDRIAASMGGPRSSALRINPTSIPRRIATRHRKKETKFGCGLERANAVRAIPRAQNLRLAGCTFTLGRRFMRFSHTWMRS